MTREEFLKVRTKPYKIPRLPDISYTMPELTFTKIKKSALGRRQKQHVDSEEHVDVDEILKTVDEIKKEIESDSDTESVTTESADDMSLNSSGGQELGQKLSAANTELRKVSRTESDTLNLLETVCADVLTRNSGKSDVPQMQFQEVIPRPSRTKKPREKISIEIVEGDQSIDSSSVTMPNSCETVVNADGRDCPKLPVDNIQICVPVKVPIKT